MIFIFININAISNSKHSNKSPSLLSMISTFLKWRISFQSFTKSFAGRKQDTYLIIFRCYINWSSAESNSTRCYALSFLFFQKPQTCVFSRLGLSKSLSLPEMPMGGCFSFILSHKLAFSKEDQGRFTLHISTENISRGKSPVDPWHIGSSVSHVSIAS